MFNFPEAEILEGVQESQGPQSEAFMSVPGSWLLLSHEGCDAKAHHEEVLGHEPMLSSSESETCNLAVHASWKFLSVCVLPPRPL